MYNAITVDVEDYYMVSAFADTVRLEDWHRYTSRVEKNTCRILDLFAKHGVIATFFVLGCVAERFPSLVREINSAGHEVASHGYNHRLIYDLSPKQFLEDTVRAKAVLEDITGVPVNGYRAASYSITNKSLWALDILIEAGFTYDSSIFPIRHDRYGLPGAERFQHVIRRDAGSILEIPPSTYRFFGQNIPVAGGGYMRLFPKALTMAAMKRINRDEGKPVVIYFHPWEIDADQPRIKARWFSRFRHYTNIGTMQPKIEAFLSEFKFRPLSSFAL